jgi:hypothetical protein
VKSIKQSWNFIFLFAGFALALFPPTLGMQLDPNMRGAVITKIQPVWLFSSHPGVFSALTASGGVQMGPLCILEILCVIGFLFSGGGLRDRFPFFWSKRGSTPEITGSAQRDLRSQES